MVCKPCPPTHDRPAGKLRVRRGLPGPHPLAKLLRLVVPPSKHALPWPMVEPPDDGDLPKVLWLGSIDLRVGIGRGNAHDENRREQINGRARTIVAIGPLDEFNKVSAGTGRQHPQVSRSHLLRTFVEAVRVRKSLPISLAALSQIPTAERSVECHKRLHLCLVRGQRDIGHHLVKDEWVANEKQNILAHAVATLEKEISRSRKSPSTNPIRQRLHGYRCHALFRSPHRLTQPRGYGRLRVDIASPHRTRGAVSQCDSPTPIAIAVSRLRRGPPFFGIGNGLHRRDTTAALAALADGVPLLSPLLLLRFSCLLGPKPFAILEDIHRR